MILSGLPGSGKTHAAQMLVGEGWEGISAGNLIRKLCLKEGLGIDRETLQEFGKSLLQSKGEAFFSKLLIAEAGGKNQVVFEGIRPLRVISEIKKRNMYCIHIYIESKEKNRLARLKNRDGLSIEQFRKLAENPLEIQVTAQKELADEIVFNNQTIELFDKSMREVSVMAIRKCHQC